MAKIYLDHHTAASPASEQFERAIMEMLGGEKDQFYPFASNAEAISHLYFSHYIEGVRNTGKNQLITTVVEGMPILSGLKQWEDLGCYRKVVPVSAQGQLTHEILSGAITPRTSLVSLSWADGLTGVIHPIFDLAQVCQAKGVLLHVDASYVIGKLYARFCELPIDFMTFEGSCFQAPRGCAGLLVKEKQKVLPPASLCMGPPVAALALLSAALQKNSEQLDAMCLETARLRDKLEQGIVNAIPDSVIFFQHVERLPNCTAIAFPGVYNEALLFLLRSKGVYASMGGGTLPLLSESLIAAKQDHHLSQCALSFSLSSATQEAEVDEAISIIASSVQTLKRLTQALVWTMAKN